jgi:hypothetical protein
MRRFVSSHALKSISNLLIADRANALRRKGESIRISETSAGIRNGAVLSSTLRRYRLEFKTRLISGKVEYFDGFGIIDILLARKFVEAGQTYDFILIPAWHDIFPDFVRNVKIKFVHAFTDRTFLAFEAA